MYCTYCGIQLAEDARFCPACGRPVLSAANMQTAAGQPAAQVSAPYAPPYGAPVYTVPIYLMPQPQSSVPGSSVPVQPTVPTAAGPVSTAAQGVPAYRRRSSAADAGDVFVNSSAPESGYGGTASAVSCPPPEKTPLEGEPKDDAVVPEPQPQDCSKPLSVWQTIVCYLALFCLPLGNIVFACVWGFRLNEHPQRRTLARAALPFIAVGLLIAFCALLWAVLNVHTISVSIR